MAELATIARPYAEALFKAVGAGRRRWPWRSRSPRWPQVAGDAQLRQFADNPKVRPDQVFDADHVGRQGVPRRRARRTCCAR